MVVTSLERVRVLYIELLSIFILSQEHGIVIVLENLVLSTCSGGLRAHKAPEILLNNYTFYNVCMCVSV